MRPPSPLASVCEWLAHSVRPARDLMTLGYLKWARHDLQQRDPMHPDLPEIVLRINAIEAQL